MGDRLGATALAAVLLGWSATAPRIPKCWDPLPQFVFGSALAALTGAPMGLRPPALWSGVRWGLAAAAPVVAAVGVTTGIAPVRAGMAARTLPAQSGRWLFLHIPLGTVWSEEASYRAALGSVAGRALGESAGRVFTAAVFGLSHVPDARATGEPLLGTVLVTGAAGWVFAWLAAKSGSLAAPMLAHLAVNEAGAVAALAVQRGRRQGLMVS